MQLLGRGLGMRSFTRGRLGLDQKRSARASAVGLHLVKVADPVQPVLWKTLPAPGAQVVVAGGVAYETSLGGLRAYDLASGTLLQKLPLGNFVQMAKGILEVGIGGRSTGDSFDQVVINGS